MAAVQLSFGMRTSVGVKTVHLLGSWDGYQGQLPLAKDRSSSSKAGSWKGTFRFPGTSIESGGRYWYYYIIDGYHVSHDPAEPFTVEPTTGRKLNILDAPSDDVKSGSSKSKSSKDKHSSSSKHSSRDKHKHSSSSRRESRHHLSVDIPKGRPLSESLIQSPKPISPGAAQFLQASYDYAPETVAELTQRFAATAFEEDAAYDVYSASPPSSVGSSLSSRSGSSSALSSASSYSDYSSGSNSASPPPACVCERYGVTRKGERIKLDCGGSRCGYVDENSSCCSDDSQEYPRRGGSGGRRHEVRTRR